MEYQLCNGRRIIPPEDIGALTDGLILSEEADYDDAGELQSIGVVFWDIAYETTDALEELKEGRSVCLVRRN